MPYVFLNHQKVTAEKAVIPVSDRGFRFGDGVFETMRVHAGGPYRFEWHMARLSKGLSAIKLHMDTKPLQAECAELINLNKVDNGLLRIQITRGSSGSGYLPTVGEPTCVIETMPLPEIPAAPISLYLSSYRRIPENSLPAGSKLCQGLNSTLARMEARDHGCFEALQLNQQGIVCEGSSSNIFWLKSGALYTPALDCGVLEGSTRAALIAHAPYELHEIHADPQVLESANAVFICNAAWGVLPVATLKPLSYTWNSESASAELNKLLLADIEADTASHRSAWQKT